MKIAITTNDKKTISKVAGRSNYFAIVEDGELLDYIDNPFKEGKGAGVKVANLLKKEGVEVLISGEFGDNMLAMLEAHGIKHKIKEGDLSKFIKE